MKPRGLSAGEAVVWLCETKKYFPWEEWITGLILSCYHSYVKSEENTDDTLTKIVPTGEKCDWLVGNYLYEIQADIF